MPGWKYPSRVRSGTPPHGRFTSHSEREFGPVPQDSARVMAKGPLARHGAGKERGEESGDALTTCRGPGEAHPDTVKRRGVVSIDPEMSRLCSQYPAVSPAGH